MPVKVFINHSHADKEIAELFTNLLVYALNLRLDEVRCTSVKGCGVSGGDVIVNDLMSAIDSAIVVLALVSASSVKSQFVLFELGACFIKDKKIIPILVPGTSKEKLPEPLFGLECVTNDSVSLNDMVKKIKNLLSSSEIRDPDYAEYVRNIEEKAKQNSNIAFTFDKGGAVLAIGAHWDDLLLGCLGILIKLKRVYNFRVDVLVLCNNYPFGYYNDSHDPARQNTPVEIKTFADEIYNNICTKEKFNNLNLIFNGALRFYQLNDRGFINDASRFLQKIFEYVNDQHGSSYNLILTTSMDDKHQDHVLTAEAAFSYFRRKEHLILEYNVKPYTRNPFVPSLCIGLDDMICVDGYDKLLSIAERKCELLQSVPSAVKNSDHFFSNDALKARMYVNAQDNGKNRLFKYAEILNGRIEL